MTNAWNISFCLLYLYNRWVCSSLLRHTLTAVWFLKKNCDTLFTSHFKLYFSVSLTEIMRTIHHLTTCFINQCLKLWTLCIKGRKHSMLFGEKQLICLDKLPSAKTCWWVCFAWVCRMDPLQRCESDFKQPIHLTLSFLRACVWDWWLITWRMVYQFWVYFISAKLAMTIWGSLLIIVTSDQLNLSSTLRWIHLGLLLVGFQRFGGNLSVKYSAL